MRSGPKTWTPGEVWAKDLDPLLERRLSVPKNHDEATFARYDGLDIEDVRVIAYTQPKMVSGVPKKVPDLMELRIGGGTIEERVAYAKQILGSTSPTSSPRAPSPTSSPSPRVRDSRV